MNDLIDNLRLLSAFYYILGALMMVFGSLPLLHVLIGVAMFLGGLVQASGSTPDPDVIPLLFIGAFLIVFGGIFVLLGWCLAGVVLYAGHCIEQQNHWTFCVVVAALCCMSFPLGTILGVISLVLLIRDETQALFKARKEQAQMAQAWQTYPYDQSPASH